MTTAAKPLPAHGTYARGNGSPGYRKPCYCDPCRAVRNRTKKRNKVNKQLGRASCVPATSARAHLKTLNKTMPWPQISALTGCEQGNLRGIANGLVSTIRRSTHDKILAVQPQPVTAPGKNVDATGTTRRIQGLRALGYSPAFIAKAFNFSETHVRRLSTGKQPTVRHRIALKVTEVSAELVTAPPPRGTSATMARNYARAHGWAPLGTWDDIDDPASVPDWTGHCGTDRGYWMHRNQKLPTCARCEAAHQEWLAERAHLAPQEINREKFRARAAVATRGADLAADARELMRLGADYEQAAARLKVTRQHLQQELLRHPEETAPQQADMEAAA